jgi:hypothetical protein
VKTGYIQQQSNTISSMGMTVGYQPVHQNHLLLLITGPPHPIQEILFSSRKMYCSFLNDLPTCESDGVRFEVSTAVRDS